MHVHRGPVGKGAPLARQHPELRVEALRHSGVGLAGEPVAPPDFGATELGSREVDRAPLARGSPRSAGRLWAWMRRTRTPVPAGARTRRSPTATSPEKTAPVTTTPRAPDGEAAVDREAEAGPRPHPCRAALRGKPGEVFVERRHPCPAQRGDREHGRPLETGAFDQLLDPSGHRRHLRVVGEVDLGDHHRPRVHAEQVEDREMLAGLGHGTVVGRDDEQGVVDRGHPGQHVPDEAFVARHVHEPEHPSVGASVVCEPEIDAQAPRLLLRQPVGIDPGQCLDEDGLAVVDVSCGRDQHLDASSRRGASFSLSGISVRCPESSGGPGRPAGRPRVRGTGGRGRGLPPGSVR